MYPGRLKNLRKDANKTQQQMANVLGITRQGYGSYENGITEPDNETLTKLADYFDTTIDYLMGRTEDRRPNKKSDVSAAGESSELTKKIIEFADRKNMRLDDPKLFELIDAAFDIVKRATEEKGN